MYLLYLNYLLNIQKQYIAKSFLIDFNIFIVSLNVRIVFGNTLEHNFSLILTYF